MRDNHLPFRLDDGVVVGAVEDAVGVHPEGEPAHFLRRELHAVVPLLQQRVEFRGARADLAGDGI
jgi:hypothetical protein